MYIRNDENVFAPCDGISMLYCVGSLLLINTVAVSYAGSTSG